MRFCSLLSWVYLGAIIGALIIAGVLLAEAFGA